jgi:cytoskeletal protein CcmA (bactofilin family)
VPALRPESTGAAANGWTAPSSINTNLGAGVTVVGSIESGEDIYIDGHIDGMLSLSQHCLIIGRTAMVKAGIQAGEIEVRGMLWGNSQAAGTMLLRAESQVIGDITAREIVVEEGARFKGSVKLIRN